MTRALADLSWASLGEWAALHGKNIVIVIVLAVVAVRLLRRAAPATIRSAVMRNATPQTEMDLRKRADTLGTVTLWCAQIAIVVIGALMVLDEFGFTITPVLTGLGIGGIAIGLGAQSLVRDAINGMFILFENQYGKGDLISVAGVQGWVEEVNLRRTVIRDAEGVVYSIPNSEVKVSGNFTRGFSGVSLLLPLVLASDVERAMALIDDVGREIATDPEFGPLVVEPPHAARVEGITDKGLTIRVLGKVTPGAQFQVSGVLRRRIKRAFDLAEIRFGEPPAPAPTPPAVAGRPPG